MGLYAATLPRGQLFKWNMPFTHIARIMSRLDIVLAMCALWLAWTRLQWYHMIKDKSGRSSTLSSWVNGLFADVAVPTITLKDSFIVYWLNGCIQFSSFTAKIALSLFLRIGLAPLAPALLMCFFGFQVVSSIILLVLAVLDAVVLFILWRLSSSVLLGLFALLALRLISSVSRQEFFRVNVKLTKWFLLLTFCTKSMAWKWNENWFVLCFPLFSIPSIHTLLALSFSPVFTSCKGSEIFKGFLLMASKARLIARTSNEFRGGWMKKPFTFTSLQVSTVHALGTSASLFQLKGFNGFLNTARGANLREDKQGDLLNTSIQSHSRNRLSFRALFFLVARVQGYTFSSGLITPSLGNSLIIHSFSMEEKWKGEFNHGLCSTAQ